MTTIQQQQQQQLSAGTTQATTTWRIMTTGIILIIGLVVGNQIGLILAVLFRRHIGAFGWRKLQWNYIRYSRRAQSMGLEVFISKGSRLESYRCKIQKKNNIGRARERNEKNDEMKRKNKLAHM
eukprot:PhF_6_TR19471/c0_g1_i1/m.28457